MTAVPKPLVVGVAGGTSSGKSTVAAKIVENLPAGSAALVDHDSYYRTCEGLDPRQLAAVNFDHPSSLDNDLLVEHIAALREGRDVMVPCYDFVHHRRMQDPRRVAWAPVVVLEGLLLFVDRRVRSQLDIKLFVDTDADIRLSRRIRRDMQLRGRTFREVHERYFRTVRPMHNKFVEPSKRWADLIVPEGGNNYVALDLVVSKLLSVVCAAPAAAVAAAAGEAQPAG